MKRWISLLCVLTLLMGLAGCGGTEASVESGEVSQPQPSVETVKTAQVGEYIIPESWTEASLSDGTWGYVTSGVESVETASCKMENGYLTTWLVEDEGNTLLRLTMDGVEVNRIFIPKPELPDGDDWSVGYYGFADNCVWFVENYFALVDKETGELSASYTLKKWSLAGEEQVSLDMEEHFGISDNNFLSGLELDSEGNPVLLSLSGITFCDDMGNIVASCETADAVGMRFVRDKDGRVYCHNVFENTLYTMEWEAHTIGQPVMELNGNESICPGGMEYDLLLISETTLRGVTFETGTVTELLSWDDCDLAGMVGDVAIVDEETYLVFISDLLLGTSELLHLSRVPADQIPEKTVVTMAVAMNPDVLEFGGDWTDSLDQMVATQMANFNRKSDTYRVEVVTYSSAEELQLMMLSEDAPDIIDWNATAWLDDTPSLELYAKKGYLVDLMPLFEAEGMLEAFIPSVVDLVKERTGGIHAMPTNFYLITLTAPVEYVGAEPGWEISDMLEAARKLPEDMALWSYVRQSEVLEYILQHCGDRYVDMEQMTCDFTNQEFYDLLHLCREYFPAVVDESYTEPSGGSLLRGEGVLGRLGQFASDIMRDMEASGRTFIGYPGAGGNGFSMIFTDELSICAMGDQQEGAWEFVKTLYAYEYQLSSGRAFCAVREDAFQEQEDRYLKYNGSCTEEESQAARELVYGVKSFRNYSSPAISIALEEAQAFFAGDKTAEQAAEIMENRVKIYLSEQS